MGWLAQRHARQEREAFQGQMDTWNEEDTHLRNLLEQAKTFEGETTVEGNVVQLKGNERVFLIVRNCPLVEPRRGPGHYQGGYQGISIPIGNTGLRYRVGAGRGTMIPGTEKPTVVDTGVGTITSQRVVFQGPMQDGNGASPSSSGTRTSTIHAGPRCRCRTARKPQGSATTLRRLSMCSSCSSWPWPTSTSASTSSWGSSRPRSLPIWRRGRARRRPFLLHRRRAHHDRSSSAEVAGGQRLLHLRRRAP